MINDIINNIEAILIGDSPVVKAYLGDTVIWEAPNDNEYANRTYRHQYFTTEALADNCVITLNIAQNVNTNIVTSFYYSRDRITWTPVTNTSGTAQTITLPAINTGEKYYWKGVNKAISQNGSYDATNRVNISATQNYKVYGNMFSMLWGDDFIGQNYFPDDTTNYIYAGFFYNSTTLVDAANLYFPGQHTKGFTCNTGGETPTADEVINTFNDTFSGCSNLINCPIIEMLTINGNSAVKRMFQNCRKMTNVTYYCIKAPTGRNVASDQFKNTNALTDVYLPTVSSWNAKSSTAAKKVIDLSTIDFY